MTYNPDLQIAAGHDNAAGLTAIESVLTADASALGLVQSYGNYTLGLKRFRSDGTLYHAGFPSTRWVFSVMSFVQYREIQATYCGGVGGFSGLVTIRTNTVRADTYGNWNATLLLPHPNELQITSSRAYFRDVPLSFIRMVQV